MYLLNKHTLKPNIMKTLILSIVCFFFAAQTVTAQSSCSRRVKSYVNINAGVGVLPTFLMDGGTAKVLPIALSADYKLRNNFSLGLFAGYSSTISDPKEMSDGSFAQWENDFMIGGLRFGAHSRDISGWNFYGGLSAGYSFSDINMLSGSEKSVSQTPIGRAKGKMVLTGFMGTRYKLTSRTGLFAELGMGVSVAKVGVSFRVW
jgi:hypothetical protein